MKSARLVFCKVLGLLAAVLTCPALPVAAQTSGLPPELVIRDWLKPPFKAGTVGRGDLPVRELRSSAQNVLEAQAGVLREAKRIFDQNSAIGLLLIEKDGSILLESYKRGADQSSVMIGYSMSKSATSVAVGQALCDGIFTSLDDPAGNYSDDLKGNAYGQASLRDLLNLASGGKKGEQAGQAIPGLTSDILRHQTRTIRAGFKEFGGGGSGAATRGELSYKNYDTYALGAALADATKQPAHVYFSKAVWSRIGAQSDAAWLLDRNGDTSTAEGFGATLRDWGRFAMYVREQVATDSSGCLGNYLRQATTKRISNNTQILSQFRGYGYGFWTDNYLIKSPSFWMTGFGGQRIGVDPASGRVLVLIAHVEDFMPEVYRLFDQWARQ
ncbi:MAG: serine hydrolase [Polaromonas sp.]|uniref:serine hydrolase domain-containing protein n=1 Tax=Polaromonas sp. TaxID=1869339 RepID=UPI002735EED5|nr:serine hydrolase [Polaromonas sp.]MDP3797502.1 serine hydrolase [Polaromonas sp.]